MSSFTIVNLKGIKDSAEANPKLEARFARESLESTHLGVSYFRYEPGYRSQTGHSHREQEEVYLVLNGSGRVKLGDEIHPLAPFDLVRVAPETVRAFEAGPDGLELVAVGSDRPEGGDGIRDDVDWGD